MKEDTQELPKIISDSEKIARSIFSPINLHKTTKKLLPNTFKSPNGFDEVSVNRLDYTDANFIKNLSKHISNPKNKRDYFGIAVIHAHEIRNANAEVVFSPIKNHVRFSDNPFHADIKINFIKEPGTQLPGEHQYKVNKLTEFARLYADPNPEASSWNGDELQ